MSDPASVSDVEKIVSTAVQIAQIATTQNDHERRITQMEAFNGKLMFWIVGTFATSFTAVILTIGDLAMRVTGVLK